MGAVQQLDHTRAIGAWWTMEEIRELVESLGKALVNRLDDHDLLIEMRASQHAMSQTLKEILSVTVEDHEKRIRFLERGLNYGLGGLAILTIVLQYVMKR